MFSKSLSNMPKTFWCLVDRLPTIPNQLGRMETMNSSSISTLRSTVGPHLLQDEFYVKVIDDELSIEVIVHDHNSDIMLM